MAIWSLTQERVEKLLKQIGDKEIEIDTLIKLTIQDIWKRDLEDFINEWRFQLDDEAKRQKKAANMGRRASNKLRIGASGPTGRKRKAKGEDSDDSDFGGIAVAKKPAPAKKVPKTNLLSDLKPAPQPKAPAKSSKAAPKAASKLAEAQPKAKALDTWMNVDESDDVAMAPIFQKAKAAAPAKPALSVNSTKQEEEDSADEEIIRPAASRPGRRAAAKPVAYILDDSDDSNGDDMNFDVGNMVKGIGNASQDSTTNARPLFSASISRPGSSAGLPKKTTASSRQPMDLDADDTDYAMLAPPPTDKKAFTARDTALSDDSMDDDEDPFTKLAPKKAPISKGLTATKASKPAAAKPDLKKSAAPAAKKPVAPKPAAEPKKMPLSPAAKAYAAKYQKARAQKVILDDSDDEVEKVANELLDDDDDDDDDDDEPVAAIGRRPARRAAVAAVGKTRNAWGSDDEDGEEEGVSEESEVFEEEGSSFD